MIYIITDGVRIKIGRTKNIFRRMRELQTGNPNKLKLIKGFDYDPPQNSKITEQMIERRIHYLLKIRRIPSSEWFKFSDINSLIEVCDRIIKKGYGIEVN